LTRRYGVVYKMSNHPNCPPMDPEPKAHARNALAPTRSVESYASRLQAAHKQVGTVVSSPDPVLAERLAQSFDYLWIDLEHGALSVREMEVLAIAARAGGAYALARLPTTECDSLTAILDTGVDGVVAPRISTPAQASALVELTTYPPEGRRGFAERRGRRLRPLVTRGRWPTDSVARIVQVETLGGVENAYAIAATPGIDALVVGTADLSLDLGCPLDLGAPPMIGAIRSVGAAAARAGKAWGIAAGAILPWVKEVGDSGASLLLLSSDIRLYGQILDECELEMDAWRTTNPQRGLPSTKAR
jgi:4-hydroxy-2-oxoheptanedioate aldolase